MKNKEENPERRNGKRTRGRDDEGVEERDGGVDEEWVLRNAKADDPVGRLKKATPSDDTKQLVSLVEYYFERKR